MLTQELTDWMLADDANINSLSRHAMAVLLTHPLRSFFAGCETGLWVNWYSEISLDLCRGLQRDSNPHVLPLMRVTKLPSTGADGEVGRYHCIAMRLTPHSSSHLAQGWKKRKKLKKQIPWGSFHGKPTKHMAVRVNTRAATKITWQTLSPCQDSFCPSVSYHG